MGKPASKKGGADARKNASFAKIGGEADGYSKPTAGTGSGGGNVYHAAPKSKENINPPMPKVSFSPKGPKSTNEY